MSNQEASDNCKVKKKTKLKQFATASLESF